MIKLVQLPVWSDNYVYVLSDDVAGTTIVVDPPEAEPVLAWLERAGLALTAVLNTHHHPDHVGGNLELRERTGCEIVGPARDRDRIPGISREVDVGAVVVVGSFSFRILDVAAHTRGHIAFAFDGVVDVVVRHGHGGTATEVARLGGRKALFVGDSLFGAGCGRLFEGDADDLHRALSTLSAEDDDALVCCAHEYTAGNLTFAVSAFPDVDAVVARRDGLSIEMGEACSSIPSLLSEEKATNPFLLALRGPNAVNRVFELRKQKDSFQA
ncbi:MAG: hydroxyacylglutathione hydrolase [Deltaproteobacteria bacterium]|nr:hydroxyacylglutathione hydrolase [Deltaproteobacteria bacterium]